MGYQITVKANAGSVALFVTGDVPDGEHVITGHDDGGFVSLHAERRDELGRYLIHASHSMARQQDPSPRLAAMIRPEDDNPPGISLANNPAGDDRFA